MSDIHKLEERASGDQRALFRERPRSADTTISAEHAHPDGSHEEGWPRPVGQAGPPPSTPTAWEAGA